jgi:hypothetical protein
MTLVPNVNGPGSPIFDELVAMNGDPREPPRQLPAVRPGFAPGAYPVPAGVYGDPAALALAPEVIAGLFANAPRDGSPWAAVILFGGGGTAQQVQHYGFSGPYPSSPGYGYHGGPNYPATYQASAGQYQAPAAPPRELGGLEQARYAPIPALPPAPPPPPPPPAAAPYGYGAGERTRQIGGPGHPGGFAATTGLGGQQERTPYRAERYGRAPEPLWPEEDEQEAEQEAGSGRGGWLSRRFGAARRESRDG